MAHYAKIVDNIVIEIIVANADYVSNLEGTWVQTSYNTSSGIHLLGGTPLRANYATVGGTYDSVNDVFYSAKPYESWTLNNTSFQWEAPVEIPDTENIYVWNEDTKSWTLIEEDSE